MENQDVLLQVNDLKTYFFLRRGVVKAVDGVSFSVSRNEVFGLVGESGCGKTITCLSILRLLPKPAGHIVGGQILFEGEDLLKKNEREMRKIRGAKISMILQDPMTSLNPSLTIGNQVGEAIHAHQKIKGEILQHKIEEIMHQVRIPSPELRKYDYPHQLSGGMRQRVAGAIAISCHPNLLIADEPTTALDVTTQALYLKLLKEIQKQMGISIIFITHDFGIVAKICDRVAVMYAGKILEIAPMLDLFSAPQHPYTSALFRCLPVLDKENHRLETIEGQPPSLINPPAGCHFANRCDQVVSICYEKEPPLVPVTEQHFVSCWKKFG